MILASQAAFESVDERFEKASRSLGKGRLETFLRISLPLAKTKNNNRCYNIMGKSRWGAWRYYDDGL
jgi:hypothetical protein